MIVDMLDFVATGPDEIPNASTLSRCSKASVVVQVVLTEFNENMKG